MIYPKQNAFIFWFFRWYVNRRVGRHFSGLEFNTIPVDRTRSILLIANHYSFWDALIIFCLNEQLFKKKAHVMILETTAHEEPFLKYAGAFTVKKDSRDVLLSLDYAAQLLHDPGNLVLMFPQGKLYPNFVSHIHFEKGIWRIIKKAQGKFQLVFAAAFIQYFKNPKPKVTVYLKTDDAGINYENIDALQNAYQQHYHAARQLQTETDIA